MAFRSAPTSTRSLGSEVRVNGRPWSRHRFRFKAGSTAWTDSKSSLSGLESTNIPLVHFDVQHRSGEGERSEVWRVRSYVQDFLLEARDEGLIKFITDNGGGGLSSSVGESALFSNGCHIELEKVPLKYEGLDQWEIWISESQERMTVSIHPDDHDRFFELSHKHAVESTVIGRYTDSGKLHISYNGKTCAYVDLDLLESGFPQWEFEAEWISPEQRGLYEPVLRPPLSRTRAGRSRS